MAPVHVTDMSGFWAGTYAENQIATKLTNAEMLRISGLQTRDAYDIDQKMNWAMWGGRDTWGGVMRASYPNGDRWREATNIRMIASVYAGQWVEIIGRANIKTRWDGQEQVIPMSEIKTYPPALWGRGNSMQVVTSVSADNVHSEQTKGIVRLPIYFGNRRAWVMDRWLV